MHIISMMCVFSTERRRARALSLSPKINAIKEWYTLHIHIMHIPSMDIQAVNKERL